MITSYISFSSVTVMSTTEDGIAGISGIYDDSSSNLSQPQRSNALANKLTNVLSTSFADAEIREALSTLNKRKVQNTPETRRRLRLDAQKEVIDCNGDIIEDFGLVAEVRFANSRPTLHVY